MKIAQKSRRAARPPPRTCTSRLTARPRRGKCPPLCSGVRVMTQAAAAPVIEYLARSRDVLQAAIEDPGFAATITAIVDRVAASLAAGGKMLLAGNGGSAADAQHLAGE